MIGRCLSAPAPGSTWEVVAQTSPSVHTNCQRCFATYRETNAQKIDRIHTGLAFRQPSEQHPSRTHPAFVAANTSTISSTSCSVARRSLPVRRWPCTVNTQRRVTAQAVSARAGFRREAAECESEKEGEQSPGHGRAGRSRRNDMHAFRLE